MLRIVGVQRGDDASREFILLQNQGAMRQMLRGHAVVAGAVLESGDPHAMHLFTDEVFIPAGCYVLLASGSGIAQWARTKDGQMIYHAFACRKRAMWTDEQASFHVLAPQHTYTERLDTLTLR